MPTDLLHALANNTWTWFLVVLFFSGSIFVHELGHFLAARWRGAHVERFSIGFGPKIFSWYLNGVEYRVSWIPLGGYVLLPQLADLGPLEGKSTAEVAKLPPITYRSKVIIFLAGAAFNILFAFALACLVWFHGQPSSDEDATTRIGYVRATLDMPDGKTAPSPAAQAGLQVGDTIRAIDGKSVSTFSQVEEFIIFGSGRGPNNEPKAEITFERNGRTQDATVFPLLVGTEEKIRDIGVEPAAKVAIASVTADSAAAAAGLQPGDVITQVDGQPVGYLGFMSDYLKSNHDKPVHMTFLRDGHQQTVDVQPRKIIDPETKAEIFRIGVSLHNATETIIHVAPWTQLKDAVLSIWLPLVSLLDRHSDIHTSSLSGPIGIVHVFHVAAELGLYAVIMLTILINVNLAIFNLLPVPVLDGGQILFATISKIRGHALPINIVAATQGVFLVLLLSMILYVSVFDVRRWVVDAKEEKAMAAAAPQPGK
ncbi:MAG TPA: RIP metalloprotease RseP [Opitutaceae bacterium]|jgi:regulator of sigma E protease|nr:RIP metalloprotease RseP [Opitutaceae bacterium]